MKYRSLPQTQLELSEMSLGTMTFGDQTDPKESERILDYALDQGINLIDTANVYTGGRSETIIGNWQKGKRDRFLLATKVFFPTSNHPNDKGLSRHHILHAVDESLKRLQTDYIDIYYMHAPDYQTSLEESLDAMDSLVQSGKIRYIGISNHAAWQMADIDAICKEHHMIPPVITQNVYNLLTRGIEAEFTDYLAAHPKAMTVYNPIAGGLLTGKHAFSTITKNTRFDDNPGYQDRYWNKDNFDAIQKLTQLAAHYDMSLLEFSMKWCLSNPHVTTVLSGVSKLSQLEQNIASIEGSPFPKEAHTACDELWDELTGHRFKYNR